MKSNVLAIALIVAACVVITLAFHTIETGEYTILQEVFGQDYRYFFLPALYADNLYDLQGFYNPFWILPVVALTTWFGVYKVSVWVTLNIACQVYACWKLKMPAWSILPFLFFGGAMESAISGNMEGIVALGLVLPPPVGMIFLALKPQIGAAVCLYWFASAWVYDGWKRAVAILAPVLICFIVSVAVYGLWFLKMTEAAGLAHNVLSGFFPYAIPAGLWFIYVAVRRRQIGWALIAIPCLAAYMNSYTWAFPIMGMLLVMFERKRQL